MEPSIQFAEGVKTTYLLSGGSPVRLLAAAGAGMFARTHIVESLSPNLGSKNFSAEAVATRAGSTSDRSQKCDLQKRGKRTIKFLTSSCPKKAIHGFYRPAIRKLRFPNGSHFQQLSAADHGGTSLYRVSSRPDFEYSGQELTSSRREFAFHGKSGPRIRKLRFPNPSHSQQLSAANTGGTSLCRASACSDSANSGQELTTAAHAQGIDLENL